MSNWTHVAGIIRIDDLRFGSKIMDFEKHFGKTLNFSDSFDVWEDADKHPEKFLPMGSEGSLKMSIWINPNPSHMAAYTVSIFGDLRDHHDPDAIVQWFANRCNGLIIRNACITVENELNGTRNYVYVEPIE